MPSFFDKPFAEQVESIIKTGDLKLLQALIGIRTPIGLSLYCSSFVVTKIITAQAKYQAYSASLDVLTEFQKPEKKIYVDGIKESINKQIEGNEGKLRESIFLPLPSSDLQSLTGSSFANILTDKPSYAQTYAKKTDISSLCTFSVEKVVKIYHNYISSEERKTLEDVLLKAEEYDDKSSYLEGNKDILGYCKHKVNTSEIISDNECLLLKINNRTFFDNWYGGLLQTVFDEAKKNKKHLLHQEAEHVSTNIKLSISFNQEVVKRVINKLIDNIQPEVKAEEKESILSDMKRIDIDNHKGKIRYEELNNKIIEKAKKLITTDGINISIKEGLQYIVDYMHVSLFPAAEQEVLNEIMNKVIIHREKDSSKKDLELLVICNGGDFRGNKLSLPTSLAFSEIERLYKDMLSIKFTETTHETPTTLYDRLPVLGLEEIIEIFPSSIDHDILKKIKEGLDRYVEEVKKVKKEIVNNTFEKQEVLYDLEKALGFSFWQRLFHPSDYKEYQEIKNFVECKKFIDNIIDNQKDSPSREELEQQLSKLDKTKHDVLKRTLLSSIDNEFHTLASELISCENKFNIKEKEIEEASFIIKLLYTSCGKYYSAAEKENFDMFVKALQKSVATGNDEVFYQSIKDIKSNCMWFFKLNKELFNSIYKTQHDSSKEMISFKDLAEKVNGNRKKYILKLTTDYEKQQIGKEDGKTIQALGEQNMQDQIKIHDITNRKEEAERAKEEAIAIADIRVEIAEARAEEAIETAEARAEEAVEIAERAKEEAEAKAETERAKAETLASLLLQIRRGELPISALDNIELEVIAGPSRRK